MFYLPDNVSLASETRDFLLSVLFCGNRDKYLDHYQKYKDIEIQKSTTGDKKYAAIVNDEMVDLLKQYNSIDLSYIMYI